MNAVERMVEYTSQQPEGAAQGTSRAPPSDWPHAGAITVNDLQVGVVCHVLCLFANSAASVGICILHQSAASVKQCSAQLPAACCTAAMHDLAAMLPCRAC